MTRRSDTWRRSAHVVAFALGLAGVGFGAQVLFVVPHAIAGVHHHVPIAALIAAFAVAESLVVHFEFRRDVHSISMSELPLVLGLVLFPTGQVLVARMLGALIALVLHRRQLNVKLAFNLGNFAMDTAIAAAVYLAVRGDHSTFSLIGIIAAFACVLVGNLLGGCSVIAGISLSQGRLQREMFAPVLSAQAVACLTNTTLALVTAAVMIDEPTVSWLLGGLLAITFFGFRSHGALRQRYAGLELLYSFTQSVDSSLETDEALHVLLAQAQELLRAEISEILLLGDDGIATISALDEEGKLTRRPVQLKPDCPLEHRVVTDQRPLLAPRSTKDEDLRQRLHRRELKDAIVIPLRRDNEVVGTFLVGDRLGHVSTFDAEDLKLFETVATHASATLENGHLIDRLRGEAASKEYLALHDSLTGLANRALFHREVGAVLAHRPPCAAVMLMDLDRFKEVNDTLGHHIGDSLLVEISARLKDILADHGSVARLGGDEFAVLLPHVNDVADAETIAGLLLSALQRTFVVGGLELEIGASVGVAMYPAHADDSSSLLQRADVAMYIAKSAHAGYSVYAAERDQSNARRLSLAAELRAAIEGGQLTVAYQPKANLRSGMIEGVEALVRWNHPRYGNLPPDEFIPVAEHTGLIRPLTDFMLERALTQCRAWSDQGIEISVAINLSARSLADTDLADIVAAALETAALPPAQLVLEITESTIMADPVRTMTTLNRLASMGVSLSIDDFGTGYSSLSYLKRLPVHEVKIDKSFVMNMTAEEDDASIVRSVVDLARNLRLRVVAEGVEDGNSLQALTELGCDVVQGYYLSKPVSGERLTQLLSERGCRLGSWVNAWTGPDREESADVAPIPQRLRLMSGNAE